MGDDVACFGDDSLRLVNGGKLGSFLEGDIHDRSAVVFASCHTCLLALALVAILRCNDAS